MNGTIAEIRMFAPLFAPKYWAYCAGQTLPINQNQALFALIGTTYGGNGINNFMLPDLRGRVPIGIGQGPGLTAYIQGQVTGTQTTTLLATNLPAHNHAVSGSIKLPTTSTAANAKTPSGNFFANDGSSKFNSSNSGSSMKPANVNLVVNGPATAAGVNNLMPFLSINYIICVNGIFPSRN